MIRPYRGLTPVLHPSAYAAGSAEIIGDVEIGADASIWFNAVIRGDVNSIRIGERTNVQDGCVLHVQSGSASGALTIGDDVTLGHGAIVHGCVIRERCLIGMGAIVLDNAEINPYTLVAAGAVVRTGSRIPGGVLVAGVPAKIVRDLTPEERTMIEESALNYVGYARTYREQ